MIVICFDGCDNLGKSTIINEFKEKFKSTYNIFIIPSTAPPSDKNINIDQYQYNIFTNRAKMIRAIYESSKDSVVDTMILLDRFCYDDGVYGKIYRATSDESVDKICRDCYRFIKYGADNIPTEDIKYGVVLLEASPKFIMQHDDGLSFTSVLSEDGLKLSQISDEQTLFKRCIGRAEENGLLDYAIEMNVESEKTLGSSKSMYKSLDIIFNNITDKISDIYPLFKN